MKIYAYHMCHTINHSSLNKRFLVHENIGRLQNIGLLQKHFSSKSLKIYEYHNYNQPFP